MNVLMSSLLSWRPPNLWSIFKDTHSSLERKNQYPGTASDTLVLASPVNIGPPKEQAVPIFTTTPTTSRELLPQDLIFPQSFRLPDLLSLVNPIFPYGVSEYQVAAMRVATQWYRRYDTLLEACLSVYLILFHSLSHKPYSDTRMTKVLEEGKFDRFAAMIHVHADYEHFETAMMFYLWAFTVADIIVLVCTHSYICYQTDDAWDDGGITEEVTVDDVQKQVNACWKVMECDDPSTAIPETAFAAMLQE
jgi:hypothetical protein